MGHLFGFRFPEMFRFSSVCYVAFLSIFRIRRPGLGSCVIVEFAFLLGSTSYTAGGPVASGWTFGRIREKTQTIAGGAGTPDVPPKLRRRSDSWRRVEPFGETSSEIVGNRLVVVARRTRFLARSRSAFAPGLLPKRRLALFPHGEETTPVSRGQGGRWTELHPQRTTG